MSKELPQGGISKTEVLRVLLNEGWGNPDAKKFFYRWVDQRMEELDSIPGHANREMATLRFMIEQARLLIDAGAVEKSRELIEHASMQALGGMRMDKEEFERVLGEFDMHL